MYRTCKTNCNSHDCKRRLFIFNSLDIIISSLTTPSAFIINFEQIYYEIFFSLKYLFDFFAPVQYFFIRITSWKCRHSQNTKAVVRRCSSELVFLKTSQVLQENICVRVTF